jgi:hypothetical protein
MRRLLAADSQLRTVGREPLDQLRGIFRDIDPAKGWGDPWPGCLHVDLDLATVLRQLGQAALVKAISGSGKGHRRDHVLTIFRRLSRRNRYRWVTLTGNKTNGAVAFVRAGRR